MRNKRTSVLRISINESFHVRIVFFLGIGYILCKFKVIVETLNDSFVENLCTLFYKVKLEKPNLCLVRIISKSLKDLDFIVRILFSFDGVIKVDFFGFKLFLFSFKAISVIWKHFKTQLRMQSFGK